MDKKNKKTDEKCIEAEATTEVATIEIDQLTEISGGQSGYGGMVFATSANANAGGYGY
jgi:hypothetical protein